MFCGYLQHFDSIDGVPEADLLMYGGAVILADYCPYVQVTPLHLLEVVLCHGIL